MSKLIKIESIETPEYVYDPVCEAPHAYISNGFVSHNCDEVEKGLSANAGNGDSGTSKRVLGTFLTWMQECKKPVFTVFTANDVEQIPVPLLRKGRLDQIFFVGLHNTVEKKEILKIHLSKRGYGEVFTDQDYDQLVTHFDGFVGAEIEAVVKEALITMFNEDPDGGVLTAQHIMRAAKEVVPLSVSHAKVVAEITAWGSQNAIPASKPETTATPQRKTRRSRNVSNIH